MTQSNSNEIEVTIKKKVTLRGKGMDVLDILSLSKTNNDSVRLTLLVGTDDSKTEPEATTFGIKVDQLKFINDLVSDELNLRPDQLQAIHAKNAEKKVVESPKEEPINVFNEAINNIKPTVEVRSRRVGGATYQVPVEVKSKRAQALAIRWLVDSARKRKDKHMSDKIFNELYDAYEKKGSAVKKREDVHKMAESNKAFAHFRW